MAKGVRATILSSLRAQALPAFFLWTLAAGLVVAYFLVPAVPEALRPLAGWQAEHRVAGSLVSRIVFCGLVPGLFLLAQASIRPKRPVLTVLATALWNVAWAVPFDWFFCLQATLFGEGGDFPTLLRKLAVDQFVWTVFLVAPANAVFFLWAGGGFSFGGKWKANLRSLWRRAYLPNLAANWCIWIPVVLAIYVFPTDLQIHVSGFVGSFWILMSLELGRRAAADVC